jgi:hypothetical protein
MNEDNEIDLINRSIAELTITTSDRVLGVVGASVLDWLLRGCLEARLRPNSSTVTEIMEKGPLSSFYHKAQMAYAMGLIEKTAYTSLCGIQRVRNVFAHYLDVSFDAQDPRLAENMKEITILDGKVEFPCAWPFFSKKEAIPKIYSQRDKFLNSVRFCAILLARDYFNMKKLNNSRMFHCDQVGTEAP